jgi:hypothetical protein
LPIVLGFGDEHVAQSRRGCKARTLTIDDKTSRPASDSRFSFANRQFPGMFDRNRCPETFAPIVGITMKEQKAMP